MNWLLDTCVISEYTKRMPHPGVLAWLDAQAESGLFVSAVSLAELDRGILKLAAREASGESPPGRSMALSVWLAKLRQRFAARTLPVDEWVWQAWATQTAQADLEGQGISPMVGLIMATAHAKGLGIATRNTADFIRYPLVFNPWTLPTPSADSATAP